MANKQEALKPQPLRRGHAAASVCVMRPQLAEVEYSWSICKGSEGGGGACCSKQARQSAAVRDEACRLGAGTAALAPLLPPELLRAGLGTQHAGPTHLLLVALLQLGALELEGGGEQVLLHAEGPAGGGGGEGGLGWGGIGSSLWVHLVCKGGSNLLHAMGKGGREAGLPLPGMGMHAPDQQGAPPPPRPCQY